MVKVNSIGSWVMINALIYFVITPKNLTRYGTHGLAISQFRRELQDDPLLPLLPFSFFLLLPLPLPLLPFPCYFLPFLVFTCTIQLIAYGTSHSSEPWDNLRDRYQDFFVASQPSLSSTLSLFPKSCPYSGSPLSTIYGDILDHSWEVTVQFH